MRRCWVVLLVLFRVVLDSSVLEEIKKSGFIENLGADLCAHIQHHPNPSEGKG
ncbi:MAG TPA: hypothetical protein VH985_24705 [Candidatus Binatia bacterium]